MSTVEILVENHHINPGPRNEWMGDDKSYDLGLEAYRRHVLGEADIRQLRILQTPGIQIVTVEQLALSRHTGAEL